MDSELPHERQDLGQISEVVGLLNLVAPARLNSLRNQYPEYAASLKPGAILGKGDSKRVQFLLSVAREGIEAASPLAERCAAAAHKRLTTALRLEFVAKTVSVLGSLGTIILLLYVGKDGKTVFAAACSFAGSLSVAGASLYRSGVGASKHDLPSIHAKLASSIAELDFLRGRLGSYGEDSLRDEKSQKEALRLVDRAEQLCKNVRVWSSKVPGGCASQV
jgi:hypothetical protein